MASTESSKETEILPEDKEKNPFSALDGRRSSVIEEHAIVTVESVRDADEALAFLENHPRAAEIAREGNAILEDPIQRKKLLRKIDLTIAPLLATVYFLQYLDKTTLSYVRIAHFFLMQDGDWGHLHLFFSFLSSLFEFCG